MCAVVSDSDFHKFINGTIEVSDMGNCVCDDFIYDDFYDEQEMKKYNLFPCVSTCTKSLENSNDQLKFEQQDTIINFYEGHEYLLGHNYKFVLRIYINFNNKLYERRTIKINHIKHLIEIFDFNIQVLSYNLHLGYFDNKFYNKKKYNIIKKYIDETRIPNWVYNMINSYNKSPLFSICQNSTKYILEEKIKEKCSELLYIGDNETEHNYTMLEDIIDELSFFFIVRFTKIKDPNINFFVMKINTVEMLKYFIKSEHPENLHVYICSTQ